jgi:hypothetical protein
MTALMSNVLEVLQECGWPSWLCLLAGLLAVALSAVAVGMALLRGRASVVLAWAALAVALSPTGIGALGMVHGRSRTNEIVTGSFVDPTQRERIREEGYRQAGSCVTVGGSLTVPPLLLAAIALGAAYALRRKQPANP